MGQISHQVVWRDGSCGLRLKATLSTQAKERERVELDRKANKDRHALLELAKRGDQSPKSKVQIAFASTDSIIKHAGFDRRHFYTISELNNTNAEEEVYFGLDEAKC